MLLCYIIYVLVTAALFMGVSKLVPGWKVNGFGTACTVAVVYSLLSFLAWFLRIAGWLISLPLIILIPHFIMVALVNFTITLGVLFATDWLVDGFEIENTASAMVGAVILGILQAVLGWIIPGM
ncbi:MAG: phage holin family protein [Candidatus Riflebacteria bacterium]|nr:phage holin family protein [Candidatus Riflebacteria bacterium]